MYWIATAVCLISLCTAGFFYYQNRKMYGAIDSMLDAVLSEKPILESQVKEGKVSAAADKALRIQEKLNLEIRQARQEKEQVKALISNMSHQLKTPLANIVMYHELLEDEMLDREHRREFQKKLREQIETLDWILQSLFKMVKLEQNVISFEAGGNDIKQTLSKAISGIYEKAAKKDIEIFTEEFEDRRLHHHPDWTAEVLENILENAVKYTKPGGSIRIKLKTFEMYSQIQIDDTGMGIQKSEQVDIFKRFYRSKDAEGMEGSGIGLYLSKLILQKEKGYMTVSSDYGKGSCFSVFLQNCKN